MDAAVYSAVMVDRSAVILLYRLFLILRDMYGMGDKLINARVLHRRDRNHGYAEHRLHCIDVYGTAVSGKLIHHIERHDQRPLHLKKLHREVEIPLDICRVDYIDDSVRLFRKDEIP